MTHAPTFKRAANTVLRALQLWCTDRPWLVASVFEGDRFTGRYVFARIKVLK